MQCAKYLFKNILGMFIGLNFICKKCRRPRNFGLTLGPEFLAAPLPRAGYGKTLECPAHRVECFNP